MSDSVLTALVDDKVWTLERPVWFSGVRQRVYTTVLRLNDGSLLLHSPAPPTDALAAELSPGNPAGYEILDESLFSIFKRDLDEK